MADQLDQLLFGNQAQGGSQDQLDQLLFSQQTQTGGDKTPLSLPDAQVKQQASAVNLLDRARLSFSAGDPEGQRTFLESKFKIVQQDEGGRFFAGNTPQDLKPVDPEGFFGDVLGELVDKIDDAIVIGSQVGGSIIGAGLGTGAAPGPGTVGGAIVGGGAGAALGQGVVSAIGQTLGVRGKSLQEEATDAAISGAFGGAG